MTPMFFGTSARRLFGIYDPARTSGGSPRAAVLCPAWGQEYIRAHRTLRKLSETLAAGGRDTLRFDYFGTGDSAGEMIEADLSGWERDIEWAVDEIKDTSGAARVALVGMRLGASLAARVASRRRDVDTLVLWDPVVRGREYIEEIFALHQATIQSPPSSRRHDAGGGYEVLGFELTASLAAQIEALDIVGLVGSLPRKTCVLASVAAPSLSEFEQVLVGRQGATGLIERSRCSPAWIEDRHTGVGAIPVDALKGIATWLA